MAAPRVLDPETLRKELATDKPAPVYLLAGPDRFRAERTALWLRERALDPAAAEFNSQSLYADEVGPGAIAEAANAYPMFGGRRFIWVRHAEKLPAGTAIQPLLDYLASPSPTTVLVLTSSKLDKRLKLTAACAAAGCAVDFQPLRGAALGQQLHRQASAHGVTLHGAAGQVLIDLVGDDLGEIDAELEKLALLSQDGQSIGPDEVRSLVAQSRDLDAFAVADLLDRRRPLPALHAWLSLRSGGGDVIGTAAILSWRIRQLTQLRAALEEGRSPDEAAKAVGLPPWQAKRLAPLAEASRLSQLERTLAQLRKADLRAKSSSLGAGLAYDLALLDWAVADS